MSWLAKVRQCLAGDMGKENAQLVNLLRKSQATVEALNLALGSTHSAYQVEHYQKLVLLGAIALQNGGEFVLPNVFLDTIHGGDYSLDISQSQDKQSLVIRLKHDRENPGVDDGPTFTPPFPPGEAATEPPHDDDCCGCEVC